MKIVIVNVTQTHGQMDSIFEEIAVGKKSFFKHMIVFICDHRVPQYSEDRTVNDAVFLRMLPFQKLSAWIA